MNNNGLFYHLCQQSQNVQHMTQVVSTAPVTPIKRAQFHQSLEEIQKTILTMSQKCSHPMWKELNTQVIRLYKEIEDRFESHQIEVISQGILQLKEKVMSNPMISIAKQVSFFREQISSFLSKRCPSLQNRKILNKSLEILTCIEAKTEALSRSYLETLEQELLHLIQAEEAYFAEELFELFDHPNGASEVKQKPAPKKEQKLFLFMTASPEEQALWSVS